MGQETSHSGLTEWLFLGALDPPNPVTSVLFLKLPGIKLGVCVCVCVCVCCIVCCVCLVCVCARIRVVFHCQETMSWKLSVMPAAEEATMVTWEELEQAITDGWKASQMVNRDGGGVGWGAWAAVFGGAPEPFPFYCCAVFHSVDVYNLFHKFSIMDIFYVFPQSYNKPCSNVTLTQVKVLIG